MADTPKLCEWPTPDGPCTRVVDHEGRHWNLRRVPDTDQDRHRQQAATPDPLAPIIFGVLELIERGDLDKWLLRLRGAIEVRCRTDAYNNHIVAGDDRG